MKFACSGSFSRSDFRLVRVAKLLAIAVLAFALQVVSAPLRAQNYDAAVEYCRETIGHPIVRNCMMNNPHMGNREATLMECRTHAFPAMSRCVRAQMGHGRSAAPVTAHGDEAPVHLATKPRPVARPKVEQAAVPPAVTPAQPAIVTPATMTTPPIVNASFGRRVALIIGNGNYEHAPKLPNATNDARALAAALTASGFQSVTLKLDLKREEVFAALSDFARLADNADWAVVYYSGHGIEYRGTNYIIPVDARLLVDRDIDLEAVDVGKVMDVVDSAKRLRLIILDACRNNPFLDQMKRTIASRAITRGLAPVEPDAGSLIVYSAKGGETALDGDGQDSPFATALLNRIRMPNLEIRRLFDLVRDDVMASTNNQQQPFTYGSLSGSEDFYFVAKPVDGSQTNLKVGVKPPG